MSKILLHACCGPCSIEPLRLLAQSAGSLSLAFINPNIHPETEFQLRLHTLREYADSQDIRVLGGDPDSRRWEDTVAPHGGPYPLIPDDVKLEFNRSCRQERCRACYRLRFEETALLARENGFDTICTTLTISPYQFTDIILEELVRAAAGQGLQAMTSDFSDQFTQTTESSRALGMYRQNYCGCRFSFLEAEAERRARRDKRRELRREALQKAQQATDDHADS